MNEMQQNVTMWTAVVALIGVISTLGMNWLAMKRAKQDREQDREDRRLALAETELFRSKLAEDVKQTKTIASMGVRKAAEAINTSNGIKQALARDGVKLIVESDGAPKE